MPFNLPIALTWFRLFLLPVFVLVFYLPYHWTHFLAAFVFWLAAITDALDGYAARKLQQSTRFGAFLDPVADKLMVTTALVLLVEQYNTAWLTLPALFMIGREIVISALREWMAEIGKRGIVAVSWVGKYKTAAQMVAIIGLIWQTGPIMVMIAYVLLYIAALLTFWSMMSYIKAAWKDLTAG
ncbi:MULTISPECIES: CDP-diacylglycerol--glycerol-3-phosphate 3-phosphatidyltransferase [Shewanella]|jgi:CDP-diacylglycerol--glycerol-3-phosphate 3-phosphatidyltransferase|uniref:CDP-diacylglycerol--glycerol-3-phosphate 3-phosphatidyltransferase n=1 Tax=Shewanella fodinae TaxID=552357 RepID=A0A4R2FBH2_9GAMM|nr:MULTISPECIES: CDP-diacylglycerol--glycerol-3-phosphate 3-phosphatidyltransferase [Shewanella]MBO1270176.1 CDP-diacylglycerol--glycerol-3-phosphate 3-phosphatidyltransferase [Shewanella sp. 4t3-1-2LB]MCL2905313.1 CDP-diacylglycerol--glycerol-3-phosphate 3-phosphatidyltransferase [Shewanella fodinae]TCN85033.1 CDP-diacylglycerol--glycerol-3-phosphate 3-phosphatidyltransferase [Shewanella fodinae]GGY86999.1 CDP-diacylglycerol--glycerol-3-phosphate 3-phosphatidyltransferase [Shewanella fodinae]